MSHCDRLKEQLVEQGIQAVEQDGDLAAHAEQCAHCSALIKAYRSIPELLEELPDSDPDEALVSETLDAVRADADQSLDVTARRRRLSATLGTIMVALSVIAMFPLILQQAPMMGPADRLASRQREIGFEAQRQDQPEQPTSIGGYAGEADGDTAHDQGADLTENMDLDGVVLGRDSLREPVTEPETAPLPAPEPMPGALEQRPASPASPEPTQDQDRAELDEIVVTGNRLRRADIESDSPVYAVQSYEEVGESKKDGRQQALENNELRAAAEAARVRESGRFLSHLEPIDDAVPAKAKELEKGQTDKPARVERKLLQRSAGAPAVEAPLARQKNQPTYRANTREGAVDSSRIARGPTNGFFDHYEQVEGLSFRSPTGYWANTYVPGDPEIRLLHTRLRDWERLGESLDQAVAPNRQPFDSPTDNALALSLMADVPAIEGPQRVRLQVGLQAIEHRRGQRPAMNLALVLNLPPSSSDANRIQARALLDALQESRQSGDRFSLVVSGAGGGLVVPSDEFRHGTLQSAKNDFLGTEPAEGEMVSLAQALDLAYETVRAGDDPSRPLGSSSVLLISAGNLDSFESLRNLAHQQAGNGITLSVVPLGTVPSVHAVDQLVLAGLGHRRFLTSADKARGLIEEELHAASRAVARSARLAIRLAPGIKLLDVIGSHRLDEDRAQEVRDIELSMDHRLSSNLGIEADRGEDEDGIQIVIPSIYSGDSLVVLVDLLVEDPGAVAEVSLRYKDLVFLKNGTLRGQLTLAKGKQSRGPAELQVSKNLLAHHFVRQVRNAADALGRGETARAVELLTGMIYVLVEARQRVPEWENDAELINDQQVLEAYVRVLTSPEVGLQQIRDSLRLTAWRKSHHPPEEWSP